MTSLFEKVKQAESQADEFRAEIISQIREEMAAEEQKAAESELNSETWTNSAKEYIAPVAFIASIGVGLGILKLWK